MAETRMQEWAEELADMAVAEHGPRWAPARVILNSEDIAEGRRATVLPRLVDLLPTFRASRGGIKFMVPDAD